MYDYWPQELLFLCHSRPPLILYLGMTLPTCPDPCCLEGVRFNSVRNVKSQVFQTSLAPIMLLLAATMRVCVADLIKAEKHHEPPWKHTTATHWCISSSKNCPQNGSIVSPRTQYRSADKEEVKWRKARSKAIFTILQSCVLPWATQSAPQRRPFRAWQFDCGGEQSLNVCQPHPPRAAKA